MKRLVTWIVVAPLAIAAILLSVANRQNVAFSLDPFSLGDPALAVEAPLFAFLFAAVFLGLLIGWGVGWTGRLARRRAVREAESAQNPPTGAAPAKGGEVRALLPRP